MSLSQRILASVSVVLTCMLAGLTVNVKDFSICVTQTFKIDDTNIKNFDTDIKVRDVNIKITEVNIKMH